MKKGKQKKRSKKRTWRRGKERQKGRKAGSRAHAEDQSTGGRRKREEVNMDGQRLCSLSSLWKRIFEGVLVSQEGVEEGDELPHAGGDGHLGGLAGVAETVVMVPDHLVAAKCRDDRHVEL